MKFKSFRRQSVDNLSGIADVRFCPGARAYQGADDVFFVILAITLAVQVLEHIPSKQRGKTHNLLLDRFKLLLAMNARFMADMEELNRGLFL